MGRRKKAEVTDMIEKVEIIPEVEEKKEPEYKGTYIVKCKTKDFLNVRNGAGKENDIVALIKKGSKVESNGDIGIDQNGEKWLFINCEDGMTVGWCMLDLLAKV